MFEYQIVLFDDDGPLFLDFFLHGEEWKDKQKV